MAVGEICGAIACRCVLQQRNVGLAVSLGPVHAVDVPVAVAVAARLVLG